MAYTLNVGNAKSEKMFLSDVMTDGFVIITVEEFEVYEPVRVTFQLDVDRGSVTGFSVLTGGTTTSLSEVRKPIYVLNYT